MSRCPTARAAHRGRASSSACAGEACNGVEFVVADDDAGLRASVREVSPRSPSRGAMSTSCATPSTTCRARPTTTACRSCAGSTTGARSRKTRRDLSAWIAEWSARYPKLVAWVEEIIEETLTFYRLPLQHQKHLKSTNVRERLNGEIRPRTYVVRIFPNYRRLSTPRSSPCRRNSRELARGPPLPQNERSQGAQENPIPPSRIDQPKMTAFAELDARHNRRPGSRPSSRMGKSETRVGSRAGRTVSRNR